MAANESTSPNWGSGEENALRWEPSGAIAPPPRKDNGWRRLESVFAHSPYQPQQIPVATTKPEQTPGTGSLPSAYQSLPSEISSQMAYPHGSLPAISSSLQSMASNLYPSIDHTETISHPFSFLERNGGAHGFSQAPDSGFTIQCGRFNAPIQRENIHGLGGPRASLPPLPGRQLVAQPEKLRRLDRQPSFTNPAQLQEYYTAQSDMLEGLMRNNRAMQQHIHNTNNLVSQGGDLESEFMDIVGYMSAQQAPIHRANSLLESNPAPPAGSYPALEPYMPQWSSESVPAELPNQVMNRLLMRQPLNPHDRFPGGSQLGVKRPSPSLAGQSPGQASAYQPQPLSLSDTSKSRARISPDSPDAKELEELARTADAEVAHRAFLVPAHKKRGKGGRQPATDPRLDPNIDERKAKRILANRLSAARSKMKQKNQMDGMSKMVSELERHQKTLQADTAELMELCEKLERQNRKLAKDQKILEEYLARNERANPHLSQTIAQRHLQPEHMPLY